LFPATEKRASGGMHARFPPPEKRASGGMHAYFPPPKSVQAATHVN